MEVRADQLLPILVVCPELAEPQNMTPDLFT